MKAFAEAIDGFGWSRMIGVPGVPMWSWTDADGRVIDVVLEPLLFGQYMVKIFVDGVIAADPVPVYPGGTEENRARWKGRDDD